MRAAERSEEERHELRVRVKQLERDLSGMRAVAEQCILNEKNADAKMRKVALHCM